MWYDLKEYHYQNIWITYLRGGECWGGWAGCYEGEAECCVCYGERETLCCRWATLTRFWGKS